jgi:hypothetical protein
VKKTTRLFGRFYEGSHARLFPDDWLDRAMDARRWAQLAEQPREAVALGIDVAAGGRDKTCWTIVDRFGVIEQIVMDLSNTMEIVGRTIELMRRHGIAAGRVVIDAGGGGKQIGDRLREQGYAVQIVGFGEAARDKQAFKNRRAELYGRLRVLIKPDGENEPFALPRDAHELRAELAVLPLLYDSEGRLMLPPKDRTSVESAQVSIRQLLGRSPDRADSLVLGVSGLRDDPYAYNDDDFICSGEDPIEERRRLTNEEIEELPEWLKDIMKAHREMDNEYDADGWGMYY